MLGCWPAAGAAGCFQSTSVRTDTARSRAGTHECGTLRTMGEAGEPSKKKNQAAAALARRRWQGVPPAERSRIARELSRARWSKRGRPSGAPS